MYMFSLINMHILYVCQLTDINSLETVWIRNFLVNLPTILFDSLCNLVGLHIGDEQYFCPFILSVTSVVNKVSEQHSKWNAPN